MLRVSVHRLSEQILNFDVGYRGIVMEVLSRVADHTIFPVRSDFDSVRAAINLSHQQFYAILSCVARETLWGALLPPTSGSPSPHE